MLLDNFKVPGKRIKIKGNLEFRTEDIAGETSGSDAVEKGIKPQILRVSLNIAYKDKKDLSSLIKTALAKEDGKLKIYTITQKTANTAGIRQVQFTEHFNYDEDSSFEMWNVSFTLREYLSNPERTEKREQEKEVAVQTAGTQENKTDYEKILKEAEKL